MPSGNLHLEPLIIDLARPYAGGRFVDIGPGFGKAGLLSREYLHPHQLDAVEAEPRYLTEFPWLAEIYDHIVIAKAENLPPETWEPYDLVIAVEVIEHIDKDAGLALLDRIACPVIVCTPQQWLQNQIQIDQGYETERHRSLWSAADFHAIPGRTFADHSALGGVVGVLGAKQ